MSAFFIVQRGEEIGRRYDLETTQLTVGRGGDNDMILNDPMVSRYHAVVKRQGGGFAVIDLGSSNPVVINDQVLEPGLPQPLQHRDVMFIGKTVFSFQNRGGASAGPTGRPQGTSTTLGGPSMASPDNDRPTPVPPSREATKPMGMADDQKTMTPPPATASSGASNPLFDDAKTMVTSMPAEPPAVAKSMKMDDSEEAVTNVGLPSPVPPPPLSVPPIPTPDRLVGTPPNEKEGDLPTQIVPRR